MLQSRFDSVTARSVAPLRYQLALAPCPRKARRIDVPVSVRARRQPELIPVVEAQFWCGTSHIPSSSHLRNSIQNNTYLSIASLGLRTAPGRKNREHSFRPRFQEFASRGMSSTISIRGSPWYAIRVTLLLPSCGSVETVGRSSLSSVLSKRFPPRSRQPPTVIQTEHFHAARHGPSCCHALLTRPRDRSHFAARDAGDGRCALLSRHRLPLLFRGPCGEGRGAR